MFLRWHQHEQCQVFMMRSVSLLPYNLSSPDMVHTLIIEGGHVSSDF